MKHLIILLFVLSFQFGFGQNNSIAIGCNDLINGKDSKYCVCKNSECTLTSYPPKCCNCLKEYGNVYLKSSEWQTFPNKVQYEPNENIQKIETETHIIIIIKK